MFGLAAIPAVILVIGMWRLPDSPRWLISKSMVKQAKLVLQRVRTVSDVSPEITDIQKSMAKQGTAGLQGLLQPSFRMPMIVGIGTGGISADNRHQHGHLLRPDHFQVRRHQRRRTRDPGRSGVDHGDVVLSRAGHLPAGPDRTEAFVTSRSCRPDCWPGDPGRCFSSSSSWRVSKVMSPLAAW